jgi:7-carboxy-7-deazaguanine synthase
MTIETSLLVSEIFHSIQGESSFAGWPCSFVRLAGCGHGCRFCDTGYAESEGTLLAASEIISRLLDYRSHCFEITGGEPLLQPAVYALMEELCEFGRPVLLETGGFLPVDRVDPRVYKIIDIKAPSSGMSDSNCLDNVALALDEPDRELSRFEFKFVLASREDYLWSKAFIAAYGLEGRSSVIFGPVYGELDPRLLAGWILDDRLPVRMQLQLHKYIWPPDMRGV